MNKIIENLNWRYASKAFDPSKKISKEDLATIIEAFRLTPSSFGLQPWKIAVVQDQELKNALVEHSWGQGQISNCSDLLVLARKNDF
jgi:nitroreductase